MVEIGNNIKKLREERHYTQEALAKLTGVTEKYISAIECGDRSPSRKMVGRLCEAFAVDEATIRFGVAGRKPADKDLQELQDEVEKVFALVGATDLAAKHRFLAEMHGKLKALYDEGRKD